MRFESSAFEDERTEKQAARKYSDLMLWTCASCAIGDKELNLPVPNSCMRAVLQNELKVALGEVQIAL